MPFFRSTFIALSRSRRMRRFCENSRAGQRLSARFVAGAEIQDAIKVAETMNRQGVGVTLDCLGESVTSEIEAHRAAETYHRLLDWVGSHKANAHISVKLTQMGLDIDPALAESVAHDLARHAKAAGSFMRVDMEESRLTQMTLDIVRRLHALPELRDAIGVVIQAYLYRSQADVEQLLAENVSVRLCKGAYSEPADIAFPRKADVDANFLSLSGMLLGSTSRHAIATHDAAIIEKVRQMVRARGMGPGQFEFQMLYGIRRDLQRTLTDEGFQMRVYVPFGREWYPYFMRRLAERPANTLFVARNLFRK